MSKGVRVLCWIAGIFVGVVGLLLGVIGIKSGWIFFILGALFVFIAIMSKKKEQKIEAERLARAKKQKEEYAKYDHYRYDIAGLDYHVPKIKQIIEDGSYFGKGELVPDDQFENSVSIYAQDRLVGYIPKHHRIEVRALLNRVKNVTVEINYERDGDDISVDGNVYIDCYKVKKHDPA